MLLAALVFIVLLMLGMPVAFAIGLGGLAFFLDEPGVPESILSQTIVSSSQSFTLLAIPLFLFAGNLMNSSGITERLLRLAYALTGHMWGSLGQVSTVMSTFMGGVSGSANADAAMQSRILGPEMTRAGYAKGYSAAVNGVTALITATLPPSMGLIIYGSVGEVSIGRLFAGGIVPGLLMMVLLMITVRITAKRRNYAPIRDTPPQLGEVAKATLSSGWALGFPILLLVGIRMGVFTPTESGAFACVYAIFVGAVVYRKLTLRTFMETIKNTVRDIGIVMILVAVSGGIAYGVAYERVPQNLSESLVQLTENPTLLMLLAVALVAIAGMFIETTVVVLLLTPVLVPAITAVGGDPVHFGLIMMTACTMGIMTPPVGIALYSTSQILGTTPQDTARQSIPFLTAVVLLVVILTVFPSITLFIPDLIFGG